MIQSIQRLSCNEHEIIHSLEVRSIVLREDADGWFLYERLLATDEMIYLRKGEIRLSVNNTFYTVRKNSFFFIPRYSLVSGIRTSDTLCECITVSYTASFTPSLQLREIPVTEGTMFVEELMNRLYDSGRNGSVDAGECDNLFMTLYYEIERLRMQDTSVTPLMNAILDYINGNLNTPLNVEAICDHVGYTRDYVSKHFLQYYGTSIKKYINQRKLDTAKRLLISSSQSFDQIAAAVGFENATQFYKFFCYHENLSPAQFRKLNAAENNLPLRKDNPMKLTRLYHIAPSPDTKNPRNSEGAFISLRDGRIAFVYSRFLSEEADDDDYCEIAVITSSDNGETWTEPRILASPDHEKREINYMSVSLMRMANGDIGVFYLIKSMPRASCLVLRRSTDELETLGEAVRVASPHYAGFYVVNNDRVIRTQKRRIIVPAALHAVSLGFTDDDHFSTRGYAVFFASDDDGFTWQQLCEPISLPAMSNTEIGLQEPGLVELPGGVLYSYFRTDLGRQYESISIDGGNNWYAPQPSQFTSPKSPMLIKQNPYSGKYYAVWNPAPLYPTREITGKRWTGGRTPFVIAESDDGVHFSRPVLLEDDPEAGFCYPAMHFIDEKTALLAY
ncbi:MAG: exo-alpha-sialidase, partial [Clostridia bacterium]|nr:exo-alpha-sialidase [Clostridia bacterium]